MRGLRILITNNTLGPRAGTELYVRDVATALIERGHSPIAYSTRLGEVAEELRAATVPVIDDLRALAMPPDVIHGHHHLETMTALLNFPDVPAIYFCHGWLPWEEAAPRFPRILRYVAVDETCRDRLVCENGIAPDRIRTLLNFVDIDRFRPRSQLPKYPNRALVFSNNASEHTHLGAVRLACERAGISLDVIGRSSGNPAEHPERVLGEYDIVFAKGRAALESLAVGAAVILCDGAGTGPMVTMRELDRLRSLNFGIRALRRPVDVETVAREIARYDAADAARVSERIRACAGREKAVDEIISLYEEVISEYKSAPEHGPREEERAASAYLHWLSPRLKESYQVHARLRAHLAGQNKVMEHLQAELAARNEAVEHLHAQLAEVNAAVERLKGKEAEHNRITGTLGWRILSRYGPVKHRFVLPAWNYIRKLFRSD